MALAPGGLSGWPLADGAAQTSPLAPSVEMHLGLAQSKPGKAALTHEIEVEDCSSWLACHAGMTSSRQNR